MTAAHGVNGRGEHWWRPHVGSVKRFIFGGCPWCAAIEAAKTECPDCAFAFDARHEDDTDEGGFSCPSCAEHSLTWLLAEARWQRDIAECWLGEWHQIIASEIRKLADREDG